MSGNVAQLLPTVTSVSQDEACPMVRLSFFERLHIAGVRHIA